VKADLAEIRALVEPPPAVKAILEVLCMLADQLREAVRVL
jgi:hypothetical protein